MAFHWYTKSGGVVVYWGSNGRGGMRQISVAPELIKAGHVHYHIDVNGQVVKCDRPVEFAAEADVAAAAAQCKMQSSSIEETVAVDKDGKVVDIAPVQGAVPVQYAGKTVVIAPDDVGGKDGV